MKKTLMTLSVLALLTACTSADKEMKRMDALGARLDAVETSSAETMGMLSDAKLAMMDLEKEVTMAEEKTQAMQTFLNPEYVFIEDGIEIVMEGDVPTLIMKESVIFDLNSADVKDEFKEMLDSLSNGLKHYEEGSIKIVGHTDDTGTDEHNMELSKMRAQSVRAYLIEKGIDPHRIVAEGKGETEPRYSNDTEIERIKNRRIEITFFRK